MESTANVVQILKHQFYVWCGQLSIDEIVSNSKLIDAIREVETMILKIQNQLTPERSL